MQLEGRLMYPKSQSIEESQGRNLQSGSEAEAMVEREPLVNPGQCSTIRLAS